MEYLCERSRQALRLTSEVIQKSSDAAEVLDIDDLDENASYLDMSMRKFENYNVSEATGSLNRNDYVDVIGKSTNNCNYDDNIYDNYSVERNGKNASVKTQMPDPNVRNEKCDCPFNGLPAAHLTIMHSPKVGWLTMHLRRKRFIRNFGVNFKRKYYMGLVSRETDRHYYEWWLLMYAGGTSDLKPTLCLQLNQFEVIGEYSKIIKPNEKPPSDDKRIQCKFELNEKHIKKDAKTYCFVAETPEHCEHWINLLKQMSAGLPYVETIFTTTAQIRKLPLLPSNAKAIVDHNRMNENIDTVDMLGGVSGGMSTIANNHNGDVTNYSEGVYEEPEEYYKNVPASMNKAPTLPKKKLSQSNAMNVQTNEISSIYDTPKKPIRKSNETKHYDVVSVQRDTNNDIIEKDSAIETNTIDSTLENRTIKIDDKIRCQLSTQLKEQSQKYLSNSNSNAGQKTSNEEMPKATSTATVEGIANKYQLSTVRKWFFSNHLSKLRQSTNPTSFMRRSSGTLADTAIPPQPQPNQRHKTNAIASSGDVQKRAFSVQPKGNKVHMIINQLEANGHKLITVSPKN